MVIEISTGGRITCILTTRLRVSTCLADYGYNGACQPRLQGEGHHFPPQPNREYPGRAETTQLQSLTAGKRNVPREQAPKSRLNPIARSHIILTNSIKIGIL
ncbi:hypothetical protein I7I48_03456 [Histoplasma ohiense]|nr:hypothetical protein I7I48_03456 [Histoplasma ohiense (nom. inval.)]